MNWAKIHAQRFLRRYLLGLNGGRKAAETFMKHLKLGSIETHVADSRTCCLHPASNPLQMTDEQKLPVSVPT